MEWDYFWALLMHQREIKKKKVKGINPQFKRQHS